MSDPPQGYRCDRWSRQLANDYQAFTRAANALRTWQMHRGAGLIVEASGPPAIGMVVAMAVPLPVGYIDVVCKVVDVVDEPDRFGFTYGTLPVHPEEGEESFAVARAEDGGVTFEIVAASRPRHGLARMAPPIARFLQLRATERYFAAIEDVTRI